MGLSKLSVGLISLACLICLTNGSAIKTTNQKADDTLKSASKTFGIKTVTRQTTHSNNGVVTREFKQTQITTGNADAFPGSTGNQDQFASIENSQNGNQNPIFQNLPDITAVDHSSGQDIVHGLLPLDDAKPVQFGTRLGSNIKQLDCSVKGGCSTQISVSNNFGQSNTENRKEQTPQKSKTQDEEQTIKSSFETKDIRNTQIEEQIIKSNTETKDFGNTKTQEQILDQGQQQPENVFGTDFDGQYEETLRHLGQGDEFVGDIKVPVVDTQFPEQGDSLTDFEVGNLTPFLKEPDFVKVQENQQQPENPLDFGYVEQQSQGDFQDVSGVYGTSAVDQQNVNFQEQVQSEDQAKNFEFNQKSFQQHDGSSASVVDHNSNFAFQQNTGFQEPFAPKTQVSNEFQQQFVPQSQVSNENSYNFQDDAQDFFLTDPIEALRYNVPGNPGDDYPIFYKVPETSFQCNQQPFAAGIYGDMDAQCQVFHFCTESGGQNSFLCPNGTVFNQQYFVCDWWYNYNCSDTPSFYNLNAQLYWDFDSFEPTQIITGTGVGSSEEQQQINNVGTFQAQDNSHQFSGSIPEQVEFQTRVTHSDQNRVHTTSTNQQIQSSVQKHGVDSYAEKRQDVNNVRTSFTQQSSSAQNTNLAQQTIDTSNQDFNTHLGQTQTSDSRVTDKQSSSVSVPETRSGSFSQQEVSSFQQNHNDNGQKGTSFDGSLPTQTQQNVNSGDFSVQEKSPQVDVPSTSSDPRRGWKPDSDSGTRFPDQSGFVQQHVDDQHKFQTNEQSVSSVSSQQTNSAKVSSTHDNSHHNQVSQEFAPTESSIGFSEHVGNIAPQSEIQQEHVQFPLEVSARSDQDSNFDSFEHSAISQKEGFTTQSPQDAGQQHNNFDSTQDVSFKRQAVFSSLNQDNVNQEQSSFDDPQTVSDQPNLLDVVLPETFEEVDQDTQSARGGDVEVVKQEKQIDEALRIADAFDGQQMIDAIQDAVNYDDIIDGFRSRNVAFMNVATTPEPFDGNQRVYENRPAQVHALSLHRNSNQNVNVNTQLQTPNQNFQQENINVDDIYSIMRGFPNNLQQQNGQRRLSFRPYGQNAVTGHNVQEQKQNQNTVRNLGGQNEGVQQNINQGIREQVIFPGEQKQGNAQNQWWLNTQNNENIHSVKVTNDQRGSTEARNQNVNTHISQSHLNVDVSSKENFNAPNNDHHVQSHNSENINQQQNNVHKQETSKNNQGNFQPIQQQTPFQNVKTVQENHFETDRSQFRNSINEPHFQNQNNQPEFNNLNKQQNTHSQHQFQTVNDQSHFNGNTQPDSQTLNNEQLFQGVKSQDQHQYHGNSQVFQNENNQQPFGNERQIQHINNQQQHQDVNNQKQIKEQNQFLNTNNQQQFQEEHQFQNVNNQQQFQNVNNQHQFQEEHQVQNVNNQQQFQEEHQFQNVNNQQQFQNVINQQQFQEQHQFQNINNQQQFENVNNNQQQLHKQQNLQNVNVQQHFVDGNTQFEVHNVNNQPHFPNADVDHAQVQKFEQNVGVKGSFPQHQSETQNSSEFDSRQPTGENIHQSQGIKGYHPQQNFREGRNGYNFPRPNLQTINANDAIIYSQNDPRSAESAISYNGWKPIIRY